VLIFGNAQCSKKIGDGPINMAPLKKNKKKKCEHTHEIIHMNHNSYPLVPIVKFSQACTNENRCSAPKFLCLCEEHLLLRVEKFLFKTFSTTFGKIHSLFERSVNDFCGLELI
jgi:hypothetical protein